MAIDSMKKKKLGNRILLIGGISLAMIFIIGAIFLYFPHPGQLQIGDIIVNDYEIVAEFNSTSDNPPIPYNIVKVNLTMRVIQRKKGFLESNEELWLSCYYFRINYENLTKGFKEIPIFGPVDSFSDTGLSREEATQILTKIREKYPLAGIDWIGKDDMKGRYGGRNYYLTEEQDLTGNLFFYIPKEVIEFDIMYGDFIEKVTMD